MKRYLLSLALLCLVATGAHAYWQSRAQVAISGGGFTPACTESGNFLARTSGLSNTERNAYDTMICGLVTDGNFSALDALYIFATKDEATASLNLKGTSFTITKNGTFTFAADTGWTAGGAVGDFLNTGFTPSTAGGVFALTSGSLGVYIRTSRTSSTMAAIGAQGGTNSWIVPDGNGSYFDINDGNTPHTAGLNAQGQWGVSRTGANSLAIYKNASSTAVATDAGAAAGSMTNSAIYIGNSSAGAPFPSTDQFAAAFIGGGITGAQWLAISNRINAYMTALSVNVY